MKNYTQKKKSQKFSKQELEDYFKECRKLAFKNLHKTEMTIFCQEVNGQLSTITKILNKKNKSEAKESILNSKFAKKPQVVEIKKPKLKLTRLGTFDYSF